MLAQLSSGAAVGLDAVPIIVEVDISGNGLPSLTIVGLPDKAVEESRERVRSAIRNSGAEYPARRIVINLAPADLPKVGPAYDLPIAIGILIASGQVEPIANQALFYGELSLDGSVRHSNGILPVVVMAKEQGFETVYVPACDAAEGAVVDGVRIIPVPSLVGLVRHLQHLAPLPQAERIEFSRLIKTNQYTTDMPDIVGQEQAKRVLEIAAAGGHNVLFKGLPGAGKTMLARVLPTIMPPLTESEAIEVTKLYSVTGNLARGTSLMTERPFRAPHHTTSQIGLIGGGRHPMPGEISLSHRGVLFLDEFPEFPRSVLEALRQPLEDGLVSISRAAGMMIYPARFLLIAAANPCPCGYFGSKTQACRCSPWAIERYRQRISGPIIDRIDLHLYVPAVATSALTSNRPHLSETSTIIRQRVMVARQRQQQRFAEIKHVQSNAEMSSKYVKQFCPLSEECLQLLSQATERFRLTARSYYRVIKVAQTIADLSSHQDIHVRDLAEAISYRPTD